MSTKKTKIKKSDKNNIISKTTLNEEESTVNISQIPQNISINIEENNIDDELTEECIKKKGRKPKGGKLSTKIVNNNSSVNQIVNVILHLKCSLKDLNDYNNKLNNMVKYPLSYNPDIPPNIMTYNQDLSVHFSEYKEKIEESQENKKEIVKPAYSEMKMQQICSSCTKSFDLEQDNQDEDAEISIKDINQKLKKLKVNLYKDVNPDKKSACFWCTYDYDNHPCYIPKYESNGKMYGYGSFCRPECAVAYLMKENIDDSMKFERYHLLNHIYSKIYNFKKNIKPAPNPYYLLEKYYGNLTIQEYRKLLKTEHMLLVIEKPMTRILPELHEDNEDFIINIYGEKISKNTNTSGVYKVKKQSDKSKGPSKSSIIKESFGCKEL
jgi:hypothetical protein